MHLHKALQQLGLTDTQAKIYLSLLESGQTTVLGLHKITGLQRPTIYDNLSLLEGMGLISRTVAKGHKFYQVESPSTLQSMVQFKQVTIQNILPTLTDKYEQQLVNSQSQVKFFYSEEGLKQLTSYIPKSQEKLVRTIGSHERNIMTPFKRKHWLKIWETRALNRVKAKILYCKSDIPALSKDKDFTEIANIKALRQVRILPEQIKLEVLYSILDDKVLFWSSTKQDFSSLTQSIDYATSLKSIFDFLWGVSTPFNS